MGDHRASIKIEMEFHGVKEKADWWINYFPGECDGVDNRVLEFFRSVYERGMAKYDAMMEEHYAETHKAEIEEREKTELARLKRKYEGKDE